MLSRLNDNFTHPNPDFVYRDQSYRDERLLVQFLEARPEIYEAHLLAYVNLVDRITFASEGLVAKVLGAEVPGTARVPYATTALTRATRIASADKLARRVMVELGLWRFSGDDQG